METHKKLTIGLFGFGVVGEGLYKVLQQTESLNASIKKVCIKHPGKSRNAPDALFTTDKDVLLRIKASLGHLEINGPNTVLAVGPDGDLMCIRNCFHCIK